MLMNADWCANTFLPTTALLEGILNFVIFETNFEILDK